MSRKDAEKKVLEYNTRVLADVLSRYLEEERENGIVSRSVVREIMATAVGDPDNPLSGRIDGTSLDETWITYINVGSQSENYGGFTLEWNGYEAEYTPGQQIKTRIRIIINYADGKNPDEDVWFFTRV